MTVVVGKSLPQKNRAFPRAQRGQALTEMAILAVILVPLFLAISILAKYAHLQQTAQQAARGAAWEATVAPDYAMASLNDAERHKVLVDRYFNNATAPIKTSLPSGQAENAPLGDAMLNTFSDNPLVERNDVAVGAYGFEDQPGFIGEATKYFPEWLPGEFPPSKNGLVTANLTINPQKLKNADGSPALYLKPLDRIDLHLSASYTLLADSWNAAGSGITGNRDRSVYQQVKSLAPGTLLEPVGSMFDDLGFLEYVPVVGAIFKLRLGYAQDVMDVVPQDRLEEYEASP